MQYVLFSPIGGTDPIDSLRRLAAREGFSPEIQIVERPELAKVQVYDFFFREFRPLLLALLEILGRSLDRTFLISGHYAAVVEAKSASQPWAMPLLQLREIEETVRNPVAHTITRVDEKWLREKGVVSGSEIVKLLKDTVQALNKDDGRPLTPKLTINWGAYDAMNEKIGHALAEL